MLKYRFSGSITKFFISISYKFVFFTFICLFILLSTQDESQREVEFNHPMCLCICVLVLQPNYYLTLARARLGQVALFIQIKFIFSHNQGHSLSYAQNYSEKIPSHVGIRTQNLLHTTRALYQLRYPSWTMDLFIYLFILLSTLDESQHEVEFNHPTCLCICMKVLQPNYYLTLARARLGQVALIYSDRIDLFTQSWALS